MNPARFMRRAFVCAVISILGVGNALAGQDCQNPVPFPELPGFPYHLPYGEAGRTGVSVGDIDGDGDPEICFGTNRENVYVMHHTAVLMDGWPVHVEEDEDYPNFATPSLVDLDDDGNLEILVTNGNFLYGWHYDTTPVEGFPVQLDHQVKTYCSPAIGDLDADGDYEIIHGAIEDPCHVFAWHHDGSYVDGWPVTIPPGELDHCSVFEVVALVDLDKDGKLEVIVSTQGGQIYVLNQNGADFQGWPKENIEPATCSSPVAGDIDGDGQMEIVLGTDDHLVYAWNIAGNDKPGWPWSNPYAKITIGLVLADLTGDEALEIITTHFEPGYWNIFVIDGRTGTVLPGWPQPEEGDDKRCGDPVAVSDIDNDGEKEIVVAAFDGCINNVCHGYMLAYNPDGTMIPGFPISLGIQVPRAPCIIDLDQDGDIEICAVTDFGYVFSGDCYVHAWTLPDPLLADQGDWRFKYHDQFHTNHPGFLLPTENPIDVDLSPNVVTVPRGGSFDLTATFTNRNTLYQWFDTALFLRFPNGEPYSGNPLFGPFSFHQKMLSTSRPFTRSLSVPANAPLGDYRLLLPAGTSVHNIMDIDSATVHVIE
jgi:hypothetical protein